jgi:hypothetical protein
MDEQTLRQLTRDRRRELERNAHAARLAALARTPGYSPRAESVTTAMLGLVLAGRRLRTS